MGGKVATDRRIAALAARQHGVLSRAQLRIAGLHDGSIDRRIAAGRLHLVHRGVFAVGHPVLTREGRWMAAVLAAGRDAVLSHADAAAAWDLRPPGAGAIHVSIPRATGRRRRPGIRIHRASTLAPSDTTTVRDIPITTPSRTIVDLAATLGGRPLEHVLDLADQRGLVDFAALRTRAAPRSLQVVLSRYRAPTFTRSELEERFFALCDTQGLLRPLSNTLVEGEEVDFVWRDRRLIVEVDGYRYHRMPSAFEDDRERDVMLTVAGWHVMRFTWAQLTGRPGWVAAAIRDRLASLPRHAE